MQRMLLTIFTRNQERHEGHNISKTLEYNVNEKRISGKNINDTAMEVETPDFPLKKQPLNS